MSAVSSKTFKALRVHTVNGTPVVRFDCLSLSDLDEGEVVIRTAYSAVNYKDAMAAKGLGKNVRTERPCVTGVDLSGVVENSSDPRFKRGDSVIVTNYALGARHDGGYAEYARVPGDWIVPLPQGLTLKEAMILGSAGLTAALAFDRLEEGGLKPTQGAVVVTGSTGGVGSLAVDIFSSHGYRVAAVTGKSDAEPYLRAIGAAEIVSRKPMLESRKAINPPRWAGAVDNVGGDVLDMVASAMLPHGRVAVCGMAAGYKLSTSVLPFILRGVDFLGINVSRALAMPERLRIWQRLATDLKPPRLDSIIRRIPFDELPSTFDQLIGSAVMGRIVVEIGGERV